MNLKTISIATIRLDGGTQPREAIDQDAVQEYARAMAEGSPFPPVVVFHDGADTWLGDGFHRVLAAKQCGIVVIDADQRIGTQRDAVLHSVGANASHGLRRTNADKRKAVQTMLADAEWAEWSDRAIAHACAVTHPFVSGLRRPKDKAPVTVTTDAQTIQQERDNASSLPASVPPSITAQQAPGAVTVTTPGQPGEVVTVTTDDDTGPNAAELLDEMERDLRAAQAQVATLEAALTADDAKAQVLTAIKRAEHAERRQTELMDDAASIKRRADWLANQLARCGRAVGVADQDRIAPSVEAMARIAKKVAA
jgi:hypothetical protein